MDEPDLATWLRDWRWSVEGDARSAGASALVEPLAVEIDDRWVALSGTSEADTIRVDVVVEAELPVDLVGWIFEELLRWSFGHPYPNDGVQFILAPDGALAACTYLVLKPDTDEDELRELVADIVDQVDEAWTLIMADALLQAHRDEPPQAGHPSAQVA